MPEHRRFAPRSGLHVFQRAAGAPSRTIVKRDRRSHPSCQSGLNRNTDYIDIIGTLYAKRQFGQAACSLRMTMPSGRWARDRTGKSGFQRYLSAKSRATVDRLHSLTRALRQFPTVITEHVKLSTRTCVVTKYWQQRKSIKKRLMRGPSLNSPSSTLRASEVQGAPRTFTHNSRVLRDSSLIETISGISHGGANVFNDQT